MDVDIGPKAREIVRRLAEVDLTDGGVDAPRAEAALGEFFARLGLPRRPVVWAGGPGDAWGLIGSLPGYVGTEVIGAVADAAKRPGKKSSHTKSYDAACAAASKAIRHGVWSSVEAGVFRTLAGEGPDGVNWERRSHVAGFWELGRAAYKDAYWSAAEFARMYGTEYYNEASREFAAIKLPLLDAYEAGLWVYWIKSEGVLALPRPSIRLREGRPHGDGVPAASWESGERLYILNGVPVPEEIAVKPARDLDPRLVLTERNAEVRREVVRKIGVERVVTELGAVCVDREGDYELLLLDLGDRRRRPFLKMRNPSVGVYHVEGVHPDCRTVRQALAWRNGTDTPPSVLT